MIIIQRGIVFANHSREMHRMRVLLGKCESWASSSPQLRKVSARPVNSGVWWMIGSLAAGPNICLAHGEEVFFSVVSVVLAHTIAGAILVTKDICSRCVTRLTVFFAAYATVYWTLFWIGADRYLPLASQAARFSAVTWLGILPAIAALVFAFRRKLSRTKRS